MNTHTRICNVCGWAFDAAPIDEQTPDWLLFWWPGEQYARAMSCLCGSVLTPESTSELLPEEDEPFNPLDSVMTTQYPF